MRSNESNRLHLEPENCAHQSRTKRLVKMKLFVFTALALISSISASIIRSESGPLPPDGSNDLTGEHVHNFPTNLQTNNPPQPITSLVRQILHDRQLTNDLVTTTIETPTQIDPPQTSPAPTEAQQGSQVSQDKLNSVLRNIREVIPALTNLQKSLSDLISTADHAEVDEVGNNNETDNIVLLLERSVVTSFEGEEPQPSVKTEEVNIPIPTAPQITDESPESIYPVVDSMYPSEPLDTAIRFVKTLTPKSQEIAFERLAEVIARASVTTTGPQDTINLACEMHGKTQFDYIASQYPTFVQLYSSYFEGEDPVYFEARTDYDAFKNFYFDRSKIHFGITNKQLPFVFQAWKFRPVHDEGCFFMIVSTQADFVLGMAVTKSEESPLLARYILGVGGIEESKLNPRFHWKVTPYTAEGGDHPLIILENRETNLVVEWDEFDRVFPNELTYSAYQLWDLGREMI